MRETKETRHRIESSPKAARGEISLLATIIILAISTACTLIDKGVFSGTSASAEVHDRQLQEPVESIRDTDLRGQLADFGKKGEK